MIRNFQRQKYRKQLECGFTLVEMAVVVGIVVLLIGAALVNILPSLRTSKSNTGMELVLGELRQAHERAIDERRIYRVTFVSPATIQVDVGTVANVATTVTGNGNAFTPVQPPLTLPTGLQFVVVSGIPTTPATTPDGFGSGAAAIDFDIANGGGGTQVFFQPDGRSLDSANRLNDGVLYLAEPLSLSSSRAVSVFGSTGRVKGWTLMNKGGAYRWNQ